MGMQDPRLVEERKPALRLQYALNDEHHVGTAGVVLVEHQGACVLIRPRQDPLAELRDLLSVAEHDGVLADEIDAADVAVEIDPDARPVEPGRDLFDVRRLAGAVVPLDQHPPVVGEAREDRERGVPVEAVGVVDARHVLGAFAERRHVQIAVEPESLPYRHPDVRFVLGRGQRLGEDRRGHGSGSLVRWETEIAGSATQPDQRRPRCDRAVVGPLVSTRPAAREKVPQPTRSASRAAT